MKGVGFMKIVISGKNIEVTNALKDTIEKKMRKLEKFFHSDVIANVTLSVQKNRQIIEVNIPFAGAILRAEEWSIDLYQAVDDAVELLERQVRKHKTKLQRRIHSGETIRFENVPEPQEESEPKIVKTKRFAIKPMDEEEAILQMELLRHGFYVFRNADTDEVNVVYKRKDGNYGLIEPSF